MDKSSPAAPQEEVAASDLERRLARYRSRVAAEGRTASLRTIDLAIETCRTAAGAKEKPS